MVFTKTDQRKGGEAMVLSMEKIKIIVANKRMNLTDMLKEAHVSTVTAGRIRDGKEVNTKTAGKLAAVLGVDVAEIVATN